MTKKTKTPTVQYAHKVILVIGDWSKDGHEISEDIVLTTNLSSKEVLKAYEKGTNTLGFNFIAEVAADYEDDHLTIDQLRALRASGYKEKIFDEQYVTDFGELETDGVQIDSSEYLDIFLYLVTLGNPTFLYEFLTEDADQINIGGYGLYKS